MGNWIVFFDRQRSAFSDGMIVARRRSTCPVVEGESHSSNSERCTRSPSVNSPGTLSCYDFAADASAEGKDANASYRSSAFLDCEKPRPRPTRDARPDEGHRTSWLGVRARAREAPRFHGTPPPSLRTGKARSDPHIRIRAALPAPFRALGEAPRASAPSLLRRTSGSVFWSSKNSSVGRARRLPHVVAFRWEPSLAGSGR